MSGLSAPAGNDSSSGAAGHMCVEQATLEWSGSIIIALMETQKVNRMELKQLGRTGVKVSQVILGCGTFGGIGSARDLIGHGLNQDAVFSALDEAMSIGVNVLDTAERYAGGQSEIMIGQWLRDRPAVTLSDVSISTKISPPTTEGAGHRPFDAVYILEKLNGSLERLGVPYVTFCLSHAQDANTPVEATLEGFAAAIDAGLVDHIGCSNISARQLEHVLDVAGRLGLPSYAWVQNGFSLLVPSADREVRAICVERGLGYTPFSTLAGSVVKGKYKRNAAFSVNSWSTLRPEGLDALLSTRTFDALEQLAAFAATRNISTAALALAWMLAQSDCTALVASPSSSVPHLEHVKEALQIRLTVEELEQIGEWFNVG
jgi:aryl-alcohol dehydrogenase-like predicted oxidoreductase